MKPKQTKQTEAASAISQMSTGETENKQSLLRTISYVVVRDGYRVSEREYLEKDDPNALDEKEFWTKVSKHHSWGEKVEIVQYDPRKHRVW